MTRPMPLVQRFWPKVDKRGPDECWPWTAATHHGYGVVNLDGRRVGQAHRVAYEFLVGPIPVGLQIDHLCRNRACVNPAHMEPVTQRENGLRGISPSARNARLTHCHKGHPFDTANTNWYRGTRRCRKCHNEYVKAHRVRATPEQKRERSLRGASARWAKWRAERAANGPLDPDPLSIEAA